MRKKARVIDTIGEFPLEVGLSAWGVVIGISAAFGEPPSRAIAQLPTLVVHAWGVVVSVAATTMLFGLWVRYSPRTISRGLLLYVSIFLVYGIAVAVFSSATSGRAGAAALFFVFGFVCLLRSLRVRLIGEVIERETAHIAPVGED